MIGSLKRGWHKAQALSVLQTAFHQPLKEPLDPLTDTDLKSVTKLVMQSGGTPFDTAIGFLVLRADAALRAGGRGEAATGIGNLMGVSWSIRDHCKLWDQHMLSFKRLGEMQR